MWRGRPRKITRFVHADRDQNEAADRKGQLANRGQAAKVKFYEVGLGTERTLEHSELQPLGELLERYCTIAEVSRKSVKFEVWDHEVPDSDTLSLLKRNRDLQNNSTDVVRNHAHES